MRLALGALVELFEFYTKIGSQPMAELLRHEHGKLERTLVRWHREGRPYRKLGDAPRRLGDAPQRPCSRNAVILFPDRAFGVAADWYEAGDPELSDLLVRDATAVEAVRIHKTSETGRSSTGHARKYVRRHAAQQALGIPPGVRVPPASYELIAI